MELVVFDADNVPVTIDTEALDSDLFTSEVINLYRHGQCLALAYALHREYDCNIVTVYEDKSKHELLHFYAEITEDSWVDIAGDSDPDGEKESWLDSYPDAVFVIENSCHVKDRMGTWLRRMPSQNFQAAEHVARAVMDMVNQ